MMEVAPRDGTLARRRYAALRCFQRTRGVSPNTATNCRAIDHFRKCSKVHDARDKGHIKRRDPSWNRTVGK